MDELTGRIRNEPDDSAVVVAGLVCGLIIRLVRHGDPSLLQRLQQLMIGVALAVPSSRATAAVRRVMPAAAPAWNRRAQAVLAARDALVDRGRESSDPTLRQMVVEAQLLANPALLWLGRVQELARLLDSLDAGDPVVAQALKQMAENSAQGATGDQILASTFLMIRAHGLAGDDQAVARIAYDDAIEERRARTKLGRAGVIAAWVHRPRRLRT